MGRRVPVGATFEVLEVLRAQTTHATSNGHRLLQGVLRVEGVQLMGSRLHQA